MSESSTEQKATGLSKSADFTFTCKFCGETKPLNELILMREYFPPMPACGACAVKNKSRKEEEEIQENSQ